MEEEEKEVIKELIEGQTLEEATAQTGKTGKAGRPPKYDYESEEFAQMVEVYAKKGFTDKEIALELGISPALFSKKKEEISSISETLSRARARINATVRAAYLRTAMGGKRIHIEQYVQRKCECKGKDPECEICGGSGWLTPEQNRIVTEQELAPSQSALDRWLMNNDEEWREKATQKVDVTSGGKSLAPQKVIFDITYNKREDCELQEGNEGSEVSST